MSPWSLLFFLVHCLCFTRSSRILLIAAHNVPSHAKSMLIVGGVLRKAGHEVSILQLVDDPELGAVTTKNGIIDRLIVANQSSSDPDLGFAAVRSIVNTPWTQRSSISFMFYFGWKIMSDLCVRILSDEKTREQFYTVMNETWDAVIIDNFTPPCAVAAVEIKSNPVIVDLATMLLLSKSIESKGVLVPTAPAATFDQPYFRVEKFTHRLKSCLHSWELSSVLSLMDYTIPYWVRSVDLSNAGLSPIHSRSSLAVTSMPNGLDYTQPRTLDTAEFDNTCSKDTALPDPFHTFINDPTSKGTIIFAMGHFVDWDFAPDHAIAAFVRAFAGLSDYRIIWQFGGASPPANLTSNVLLNRWLPQAAILNHPKTRLFISHMGYKSMREAICARVPVLAMPMFGDQMRNTATAQYRRFALFLNKWNLTPETVLRAINRVLNDESYTKTVGRLQDQMEDRIRSVADSFTFQLEFFMRHNNEKILNKYIRNKWKKLTMITRSWNSDIAVPIVFLIGCFSMLIL